MSTLGKLFDVVYAKTDEERSKALTALKTDEATAGYHELIETSAVNASFLVRTEVLKKVIEGVDSVRVMRDVFKGMTWNLPTPSYRVIVHQTRLNDVLPVVPPTSDYPVAANESYTEVRFDAKKYGEIAMIEEELIKDSMFDVVEMRLRDEGKKAENTLNRKALDTLLGQALATKGYDATKPVESIADAIYELKNAGYNADSLLMTVEMERDLFKDPHFTYEYSGETGRFRTQELGGKILGLKPYLLTVTDSNGSWGGTIKGTVFDSSRVLAIGMYNDVTLEKFNDPRNDLMNLKVAMRFDVKGLFQAAVNLSS